MRAFVQIRPAPEYRSQAFVRGLQRCGYEVFSSHRAHRDMQPTKDDVLVTWNRYAHTDLAAQAFEKVGGKVLIAENGYLGREWQGGHWYAVSRNYHNGAGWWPQGDGSRWAKFGIELKPWKMDGTEIVILDGRGIGPDKYRQPKGWAEQVLLDLRKGGYKHVNIRQHPGEKSPPTPLDDAVRDAYAVIAWASGAALKSLCWGIPVFYGMAEWIGKGAARPLSDGIRDRFLGDRLPMFERLAWAMWSVDELQTGEPFKCLLQ